MLVRSLELVASSDLSDRSKELLLSFKDECLARGLGEARVCKHLWQLRKLIGWLGTEPESATVADLKRLVARVETSELSPLTKLDHKIILRIFFTWLSGGAERPATVSWISTRSPIGKRRPMPTDLLTQEDVARLIRAAQHPRDRAFVAVLYESGARIGEMLGLRLRDVVFDAHGMQLFLDGKTGQRRIRLVSSTVYMTEWLNAHPRLSNPDSPVWATRDHRAEAMEYRTIAKVLRNLRARAGMQKPVNPHHFRHSRATHLASFLTEAQMKAYMGWVQGSAMAATYVHLSGRDVDRAILALNGVALGDEKAEPSLRPQRCLRCQAVNPPAHRYCATCGLPLNEQSAVKLTQPAGADDERLHEALDRLLEQAEFRRDLVRRLLDAELLAAAR